MAPLVFARASGPRRDLVEGRECHTGWQSHGGVRGFGLRVLCIEKGVCEGPPNSYLRV